MTVRVRWQGIPEDFTTWEELHAVHRLYPDSSAWGHAESLGEGIVIAFLKIEAQRKIKWAKQADERRERALRASRDRQEPTKSIGKAGGNDGIATVI